MTLLAHCRDADAKSSVPKSQSSSLLKSSLKSQSIASVYDSSLGSQEAIVERAKQVGGKINRFATYTHSGLGMPFPPWSIRWWPEQSSSLVYLGLPDPWFALGDGAATSSV